jgi:polyisoprenoid-binding protein YceI
MLALLYWLAALFKNGSNKKIKRIEHFILTIILFTLKLKNMSTTKWVMDPTHSEIQFKVRHLMVSYVTGHFTKFNGTVETSDDDLTSAKVRFTAEVDSISTNNEQRDAHLKNPDFFDAENHPQIIFESDRLEKINDDEYKVYGRLTIRGVTKSIVFNAEYGGVTVDPWGNTRTGFSLDGKINRKDFGVSFGMVSETGNVLLGEEVKFNANAEFVKEAELETVAA